MKQGVIHQVGSPNELLFFPKDQFVEEFLGSSGFFNVLQLLSVKEGMITVNSLPKLTMADESRPPKPSLEIIEQARKFSWNLIPVVDQDNFFQGMLDLDQNQFIPLQKMEKVLNPNDSFEKAIKDMFVAGSRSLPVLDQKQKLIGIFDFVRACRALKNGYPAE